MEVWSVAVGVLCLFYYLLIFVCFCLCSLLCLRVLVITSFACLHFQRKLQESINGWVLEDR